jgi:putative ABC transport system substrate-binding protein
LEFLKEAVPTISRVGVLLAAGRIRGVDLKEYEIAAQALKIQLLSLIVQGPEPDLQAAFQAAAQGRVNGLVTGRGPVLNTYRKQIADLAIMNRLPLMSEGREYVEAGAFMSYATNDAESSSRAATYVDKLLKGAKPADLPVEQPTKFELVINLKTAKQIGLTIPPNVLARADRVIK